MILEYLGINIGVMLLMSLYIHARIDRKRRSKKKR